MGSLSLQSRCRMTFDRSTVRSARCVERLKTTQTGERRGSRPKPPKAGARSASLEPGRSPGYAYLHSCSPARRARGSHTAPRSEIDSEPGFDLLVEVAGEIRSVAGGGDLAEIEHVDTACQLDHAADIV